MSRPAKLGPSSALIPPDQRAVLQAAARLAFENPFAPERAEAERAARDCGADPGRVAAAIACVRDRLAAGAAAGPADLALYEDACFYALSEARAERLQEIVENPTASRRLAGLYRDIAAEHERLLGLPALRGRVWQAPPEHVFACIVQMWHARHVIASTLMGTSRPAAELRAEVWRSIFTDDLRAYVRDLYDRLDDVPTLVTGPTGTGKDLVARTIGVTRYVPFDPARMGFVTRWDEGYRPLNLAAMSPSLIEAELFGYARGAFTGAVEAQRGWLACGPGETVFLDEIGEVSMPIQAKLLRVLQTRELLPIGSRSLDRFGGKLVTATHRDLQARIREGAFREDFFYRICSDWIVTPSLREQLDDDPDDLHRLVRHISSRAAGPARAEALAEKVERWLGDQLPTDYAWPGNVRELEVCVRSVMMRSRCRPPATTRPKAVDGLLRDMLEGKLSLRDAQRVYATLVYAETNNLVETARRLAIDRGSVPAKIDRALFEQLRALKSHHRRGPSRSEPPPTR